MVQVLPIIGAGRYFDDGSAAGIEGNDNNGQDSSTYLLEFGRKQIRGEKYVAQSQTLQQLEMI